MSTEREHVSPEPSPPLRNASLVIYLTTAILLLMFPVALANWTEDKDLGATAMARRVVFPVTDFLGRLGPAGWNAAARDWARTIMKRSE